MFQLVLVEPEIPPNTGSIARLALASSSTLHLVGPLGFSIDNRALRRAGLDYWEQTDVRYWENLAAFEQARPPETNRFFLTTKATRDYWQAVFRPGDYLYFGRETRGLPETLLHANPERCYRIPMREPARSLNLATAVAIVLYEGLRQNHAA